jgi:branched-chain amino acid transport system substrate-binding protein
MTTVSSKPQRSAPAWRARPLVAAMLAGAALVAGSAMADVKIGVLMPLTGKGASYGLHQQVAIQMMQDEIAKSGIKGQKLEIVAYDTRGDNAETINLTRRLVSNDKVLAIIGPYLSAEAEVAFPIAARGKTPIMTASASKPGITAAGRPWAFRNALSSDQMNGVLIDTWIKANPQIKSVVIFTDGKDAFSKIDGTAVFPEVLKAHNIKVLDNLSFQTGDIDFAAQVTKAKELKADGIVVAGLYNEGGNLVREIRKQGLEAPIAASVGLSSPRYLEIAGAASEGSMVVNPFWPDNPEPRVAKWTAEYMRHGDKSAPTNTDALMYDSLYIMKSCIESSGVTNAAADLDADRERIRGCIEKMPTYQGIVGPIRFNEKGDAVLQPIVLQAKAGKWVSVK